MRGHIRLRWIVTCGSCQDSKEFLGMNPSGSRLVKNAGWIYTIEHGYQCPGCRPAAAQAA